MNLKLRVCVIDDEPHVRKALIEAINETTELEVIGEAGSYSAGVDLVQQMKPDALFLDIKLLEGDAFQLLNSLKKRKVTMPAVILNTGYAEFEFAQKSINDFRDCVIKILQKPFWENWNSTKNDIVDSILLYKSNHRKEISSNGSRIKLRSDNDTWFFKAEELIYFQIPEDLKGSGKLQLHTTSGILHVNRSVTSLLDDMPPNFIRVSRYAAVNADYVERYDHSDHVAYLKDAQSSQLGVGMNYYRGLLDFMGGGAD